MSKGTILLYDDDKSIRDSFGKIFPQLEIDLTYLPFETEETLVNFLLTKEESVDAQVLIFDLAKNDSEIQSKSYSITKFIKENFNTKRLPLFIHAAFADEYSEFNNNGTVFKIKKSDTSIKEVCETVKLLFQSGFLEIFRPNGIIENSIMRDLHSAFIDQFTRNSEILNIITAIREIPNIDHKNRITSTFQRIAIRSLMSKLMIDNNADEQKFNEVKISAVEHYIRRINLKNIPIWTGDIFSNKEGDKIVILTPRCDVATKGKESLLICHIEKASELTKKEAPKFMKDNITSKKFRYLPNTPIFEGGKVNLSEHFVITKQELANDYIYTISLSEDLTNEIVGKFCSYLLRTSIPEVDETELVNLFQ